MGPGAPAPRAPIQARREAARMPVILTTDALIFLLIAVALGYGVYASQHE
ncbi:MAG: hypothetical protein GVY09_04210, partial [Gammaproteobacteria bacterium]|nr:hypothetical protein [Gammaproteobacteria bacterium]